MSLRPDPRHLPGKLSVDEANARVAAASSKPLLARLQDAAELWIYALNEKQHWIFRVYDAFNETWARLVFRGLRRRAAAFSQDLTDHGASGTLRLVKPSEIESFAEMLEAISGLKYLPPHPLDRKHAEQALRRASYLPFGIFQEGKLIGYVLLRLFFLRRVVSGIWMIPDYHFARTGTAAVLAAGVFTRSEHIPDYVTIPVDNHPSLLGAQTAGWRIIRSNRRFHVLLR